MNSKDFRKLAMIFGVLCLASAIMGSALTILVHSRYTIPYVSTQASSKLDNLQLDGRFDRLVLGIRGYTTQTTNLIEAQQYDDSVVFSVDNDGNTLISGTATISGAITLTGDLALANVNATGYVSATSNITSAVVIYGVGLDAGDADIDDVADIALDTISADDGSSFAISSDWTNAGRTVANLGTITTIDINGGTIDGVAIGGASANTGRFTTVDATTSISCTANITGVNVTSGANPGHTHTGASLSGIDISDDTNLTAGDHLTLTDDDLDVDDDFVLNTSDSMSGRLEIGTFLNLTAQTSITVTNSAVFTPTGTYQLIVAAGEVTPTIATTGFTTGDQLELHNTGAAVINLVNGGTQLLKDDYPMDQYDVLGLRWNGTAWVELYRTGPRS